MSGQQWEVVGIREYTTQQGEQKSHFFRVGRGFTNRDGSINILLEAVPVAGAEGQVKLQLQVPLERDGQQRPARQQQQFQQRQGGGGGQRQRYGQRPQGRPQRVQAPDYPQQGDADAPPDFDGGADEFPPEG